MAARDEREAQRDLLQHFFKPVAIDIDDEDGDDNNGAECWELKDVEAQTRWSLLWAPWTDNVVFAQAFRGPVQDLQFLTQKEKVTDVVHETEDIIKVHCVTTGTNPYMFTILVNNTVSPFNIKDFVRSIEGSKFDSLIPSFEQEIEMKKWVTKTGQPLKAKAIATKLRRILVLLTTMAAEERVSQISNQRPISLSVATGGPNISEASAAVRTPGGRASRSNRRDKLISSPSKSKQKTSNLEGSSRKKGGLINEELLENSIASALAEVPQQLTPGEVVDYTNVQQTYEKFWTECQDCFVFDSTRKLELDVQKLHNAPVDWTIRAFEPRGVDETKHFLINMPDKSVKQTLCVMPKLDVRPDSVEDMGDCDYWIINGQHSVAASKEMINSSIPESIQRHFRTWQCFIVWTKDKEKLRRISAYYNRVNHFSVFKPTWATNVLASRPIWVNLGKPMPKHTTAGVGGVRGTGRRTPAQEQNDRKYEKFLAAIKERFSMIDVQKSQDELRRSGKSSSLTLINEVKIITSSDETFKLWSEVISSAAQGELIDVDSPDMEKFRMNPKWVPQKDGILNREFFKWLGNMSESDHAKLCKHILGRSGPSRTYRWPKVVIKQPTNVVKDCLSAKEWVERRKRKQIVRLELNNIRPQLRLFNSNGDFVVSAWKKFKKDYNVSRASMRVLLEQPGEKYFNMAKQTQHRNSTCEELSPYAKEFFKVFLQRRSQYEAPKGTLHFRSYNAESNTMGNWPGNSWDDSGDNVHLGIIDFRNVPGFSGMSRCSASKPYFEEFMNMFSTKDEPSLTELRNWLWICGDEVAEEQVLAFARRPTFSDLYDIIQSEYVPGKFERLGGYPSSHRLSKERVRLVFLIKKGGDIVPLVRKSYVALDDVIFEKARKYNELEYQMYTAELRMEFFIKLLSVFCKPGDSVFLMLAGTKALVASVLLSLDAFCISHSEDADDFEDSAQHALTLDKIDFLSDGYRVDVEKFPHLGKTRGKGKDKVDDDRSGPEDEDDESIIGAARSSGVPASSSDMLEDSDDDVQLLTPMDVVSQTQSEVGGTGGRVRRDMSPHRLLFPDVDALHIFDRPGSAPLLGESSEKPTTKRRKLRDSLGRSDVFPPPSLGVGGDDMKYRAIQEQLNEEKRLCKEMQAQLLQEQQETRNQVLKSQNDMMAMLQSFLGQPLVAQGRPPFAAPNVPASVAPVPMDSDEGNQTQSRDSRSSSLAASPTPGSFPVAVSSPVAEPSPQSEPEGDDPEASSDVCIVVDANSLPVVEVVVEAPFSDPITQGTAVVESRLIVSESPAIVPDQRPQAVVELLDVENVQQSLGSMGLRDDFRHSAEVVEVYEASISGASNVEEIDRVPSHPSQRWLNVVLDLNGILCVCEPAWQAKGFNTDLEVHSTSLPTRVGPKLVRVRPGCSEFLNKLSSFATITVWSSMLTSTTKQISDYLFVHSAGVPVRILGQEDCDRVPDRRVGDRIVYLKERGTQKDIFLKTLSKKLFDRFPHQYTPENTLVIDDSPTKHMLNNPDNVLLLPTWSFKDESAYEDLFLVQKLLPYLLNLHCSNSGLGQYRSTNPKGRAMFYNDRRTCSDYVDIMNAIQASTK